MTIILLDPAQPGVFPVRALNLLDTDIEITEDVPASVQWTLRRARLVGSTETSAPTLISTDEGHSEVIRRKAAGSRVVAVPRRTGSAVMGVVDTVARARALGPWEAKQTHESLLPFLVEESWELADAVAAGNPAEIRSELGDVLLQVIFHSQIASEAGRRASFTIDDVAEELQAKLIRRMPFLSGSVEVPGSIEEQDQIWREKKRHEAPRASVLTGVSLDQPALSLAQSVVVRLLQSQLPVELLPVDVTSIDLLAGFFIPAAPENSYSEESETESGEESAATPLVGESTSAELSLRRNVLRLVERVQVAETAERAHVEAAGGVFEGMNAESWRRQWFRTSLRVESGVESGVEFGAQAGETLEDEALEAENQEG